MADGGVHGHVEHPGGLAHGRPRGHDDQVLGLQARGDFVQPGEPGGHAGDLAPVRRAGLQGLDQAGQQIAHAPVAVAPALLRHLEEQRLGLVQELPELAEIAIAARLDLGASGDHPTHDGLLLHQAHVVADVLGRGHGVGDGDEVRGSAFQSRQAAAALELVAQRHHVDGLLPARDLHHRVEDLAVGGQEEVVRTQRGGQLVEHDGLDQHAAKRGAQSRNWGRYRPSAQGGAGV